MHIIHYRAFMKTLTIRNVPRRLADALNRERRRRDASLNSTVLDVLSRGLGVDAGNVQRNGLAALAGTWTVEQQQEFDAAVGPLETVDDDMWA